MTDDEKRDEIERLKKGNKELQVQLDTLHEIYAGIATLKEQESQATSCAMALTALTLALKDLLDLVLKPTRK